ncbi:hypothetical protein [Thermoactinomyces mirandus]|uniref:Immunity protein 49 n=1 Tax=Thermoactinomyces mirandus TaxID=2756294 RepID=A0A7W1XQX7_9BACL|nr:hypothetical protein [Thermoactinomyces mirandus]MBA4601547.1 hypothetical protein [Thermoactinomyces mirandus]
MSQDLLQGLKNVVDRHEEDYFFKVEASREDPTLGNWLKLDSLSHLCYSMAVKRLVLEKNVIEYKQQLYKSGRYLELYILSERLNVPHHPRYVKGATNFKSTADYYGGFYSPLISQNKRLIESMAHLIGWRGEEDFKVNDLNPELGHLGFAVKYIVLREDEKAIEHLETLSHMKLHRMQKKSIEEDMFVLKGILEQNPEQVNEGLAQILKSVKEMRKRVNILGKFYAHPVAGLGWLAQYRGINVEIDDPLCPREIFQTHEFVYPEVDWIPEDLKDKTWKDFVARNY